MAASARQTSIKNKHASGRMSRGGAEAAAATALHSAIAAHQAGQLEQARPSYEAVLAIDPDNVDALQLLGVLHHQLGDSETGIELLTRATILDPENIYARNNFGGVLKAIGRFDEAERQFAAALKLNPDYTDALVNRGAALLELGRFNEARTCLTKALVSQPNNAEALRRLSHVYMRLSRFAEAEVQLRAFLVQKPQDAEELANLAYALQQQGRIEEGQELFGRVIRLAEDNPILLQNLRDLLGLEVRDEQAREKFRESLRKHPALWPIEVSVAANLMARGKLTEAQEILDDILEVHADNACVWNDIGAMLLGLGRHEHAKSVLLKATEINPKLASAHNNLGNVHLSLRRADLAVQCYRRALTQDPGFVEAQATLTRALRHQGKFDEAHLFGRAALDMPRFGIEQVAVLVQMFKTLCDFEALDRLGDIWANCDKFRVEHLPGIFLDLLVFAQSRGDTDKFVALVRKWASNVEGLAAQCPLSEASPVSSDGRLRVGILSSDLQSHSVSRFLVPLLRGYDRSRMSLYCYTPSRVVGDAIQEMFRRAVDKFTFVDNMTHREIAQAIRNDGVDVLLELNGFTQNSRLEVMAFKPAPVQMSWLGYPFTCGLKAIDYVVMDRFVKPTDESTLIETPLIMPDAWVCFGKFADIDIDPVLPMDRRGVLTFGTLNNPYKYNRETIALWARVMAQVPNSRFLIVRPEVSSVALCRHLAHEFAKHGIASDRLFLFDNRTQRRDHLTYYNDIDISLDTFPLTGGTTTCEALWMGVPVVSLVGESFHQRISYSALMHCGLEELCTVTPDDYVTRAVALAGDRGKLAAWRTGMRDVMRASPLCDEPRFLYQFQEMLEQVAQQHGLR